MLKGVKKESYPFDWIFSTPDIIIDCINTNFAHFLNKENCTLDIDSVNNTNKYYYPSNLTMYNHRNILRDNDYEYFIRCISRFNKLLMQNKKKLFIIVFSLRKHK